MRRRTGFMMMGIGFTLGIVMGLLIQLPVITLPVNERDGDNQQLVFITNRDLKQNAVGSLKSDLSLEGLRLQSPGTAKKHVSLDNPLRGLRPSLHGVVYSPNNGSKTVLEEKSKPIHDITETDPSKPNSHGQENRHPLPHGIHARSGADYVLQDWTSVIKNIVDGVIWTPFLHSQCSSIFNNQTQKQWQTKASSARVVKMAEGCGRMQNRLVTFSDGSKACARYRLNTDQIQGEIYSFYLAELLNLNNLPPSSLQVLNSRSDRWKTVHADMANAEWADDKIVVLTQWIENLKPAYIPFQLRSDSRKLYPTSSSVGRKSVKNLCNLVQWTDLIIFDYLTANLDRVVNNMFNKQWNDQMMDNPAHNLETTNDGNLIFLDNESGLFHGYRLLEKYAPYHKSLLDSVCIFSKTTVSAIEKLHHSGNAGEELHSLFIRNDPAHPYVPKIPKKNMKILQQRISDVYDQIQKCRSKFS